MAHTLSSGVLMPHRRRAVVTQIVAITVVGCATIIRGSSQDLPIASQPTGAQVTVDNKPLGVTPVTADLKRKDKHTIVVKLDGYQPFEMNTTRSTSGWIAGNIIFGGLIGLAVDAITGAMYNVRPETINAQLARGISSAALRDGTLYVFLVREADPTWQKIGQLTPVVAARLGR